jgi:DNA-binding CsgD family transcriptional regulator
VTESSPLSGRLEERFLGRVRELPEDTQMLMLLAAADSSGEPALVWRAAERLGIGIEAASAPGIDELLSFEPRIAFRLPLIRSAVYKGASPQARRQAHGALAAASDPELDGDRRAWHLAEAAAGPDEQVASELERLSERARGRGGWASVAAFLERSAQLTPEERRRAERALSAAHAKLVAGDPRGARALLERATARLDDPLARARARRLDGSIQVALGEPAGASSILLEAARTVEPLDARLARETLLEALSAATYAGREKAAEIARAAAAVPAIADAGATAPDLLLDGLAVLLTAGYAAAVPALQRALVTLRAYEPRPGDGLGWLRLGRFAAAELMDDEAAHAIASRWVQLARERGALTTLPAALTVLAIHGQLPEGQFSATEASLNEAREISAATGNPGILGATGGLPALLLLAWRGQAEEVRSSTAMVGLELAPDSRIRAAVVADYAVALLELGLGNYQAALTSALNVYEDDSPWVGTQVLPDLIEAAVRAEERGVAASGLARLSERALASGTELALGLLARSRALLADDDDAGHLYERAIEHLQRCRTATALARAHLLHGEWLCRQRRGHDARDQLRTAYEMLDSMGADAFARRALTELLATGEHPPKRTVETSAKLTPQEVQIARLASEGASNHEIAAQLFLSPGTVAHHLDNVFRKLDINNREQLTRALPQRRD